MGSFWTAEQVADLLKIKPKTVLAWAATGYLPCIRLGQGRRQAVRFRESAIMAFIESKESGAARPMRKKAASGGRALDCLSRGQDLGILSAQEDSGK